MDSLEGYLSALENKQLVAVSVFALIFRRDLTLCFRLYTVGINPRSR